MPVDQSVGAIAYLTGEYPKVSHTFIQREVQELRKRGLDIQTFSIRRAAQKDILADQKEEERTTFYVVEKCKQPAILVGAHLATLVGAPARYLKTLRLAWKLRQPGLKSAAYNVFYFMEAVVLARELRRRGVTHLHNHFGNSSCNVAVLASELSGIPFSFTEHGPAIFFEAERWRLDEKIARASFVIAISHFCRSQLMLFSNPGDWKKISIVHCGVYPSRYKHDQKTAAGKHVLYVGRLEPVKGLPVLLEAVSSLANIHSDMTVTVVGDGAARPEIEQTAQRLGLSKIVRFVGYKTQEEVAQLLAEADMLVLPSFAEGVPVVLMEAMASGKPVIASRVAGVSELVQDGVTGFTVPPGDWATMAARMNEIMVEPDLGMRMGKSGKNTVELEFNIEIEAERLSKIFLHAR